MQVCVSRHTKLHYKKHISVLHLNARSLKKNFSEVNTLLNTFDNTFSAIGVTETWLKSHNVSLYNIDGYVVEHSTRVTKIGGGVSLYINEKYNYKTRNRSKSLR